MEEGTGMRRDLDGTGIKWSIYDYEAENPALELPQ